MTSLVHFMDLRASYKNNLLQQINCLMDSAGVTEIIKKRDLTAVKLHFGEFGNTAFIRPVFIRQIVDTIKSAGGEPFLTDTNTLYLGTRTVSPRHIRTALQNGFSFTGVDAPVIIADGLRGTNEKSVSIDGKHFKSVHIASDIINADAMISVAHFKGHEFTGFGGTLKNIAMGCASRKGKLAQHATVSPKIKQKKCVGCGDCLPHCPASAIALLDDKAVIDGKLCIGCGQCIIVCPQHAPQIPWSQDAPLFMEKMVEYVLGTLKGKNGKTLFINFITDVSPACDCPPFNDAPIVRDIGILASKDPVAVDQAAVDLINKETANPGSALRNTTNAGADKFKTLYPDIDWEIQLEYAEQVGLGSRQYELVPLDEQR